MSSPPDNTSGRRQPAEPTSVDGVDAFTPREWRLMKFVLAQYRHQIGVRGEIGGGSDFVDLTD